MSEAQQSLTAAMWRIYRRPERPLPWAQGGNLPWNDPTFSERMLREHLDDSHGAASRRTAERILQLDWLWSRLALSPGAEVLDVTCGPGFYAVPLAQRGCRVTGIDFAPASIAYARRLAAENQVADRCHFLEQDVRLVGFGDEQYDASLLLYGQLAVFPVEEAVQLAARIARALRPGGRLCLELLNQDEVDKRDSTWWFTDEQGLWGDTPFLHLGERFWIAEQAISVIPHPQSRQVPA
jgi:SAM-dependent methyltransferase